MIIIVDDEKLILNLKNMCALRKHSDHIGGFTVAGDYMKIGEGKEAKPLEVTWNEIKEEVKKFNEKK